MGTKLQREKMKTFGDDIWKESKWNDLYRSLMIEKGNKVISFLCNCF